MNKSRKCCQPRWDSLLPLLYQPRCATEICPFSNAIFLIAMDSLLCHLSTSGLGFSINGLTIGSAAHADDIRSTSNSIADLQGQGAIIEKFVLDNSLKLNASKTELIKFSANAFISAEGIQLTSHLISTQTTCTAKCLGYWWRTNVSLAKSIAENISKSCRAFFALGSIGAYQAHCRDAASFPPLYCQYYFTAVKTGY